MMQQFNWTEILLGLMTLLGSCGWFVAGKKYKQEVEGMKTDNQMKKLDLSSEFAAKFKDLIVGPLEEEVGKLRTEVKDLKDAIEGVYDCPFRDDCPVRERMRDKSHRSEDRGEKSEG